MNSINTMGSSAASALTIQIPVTGERESSRASSRFFGGRFLVSRHDAAGRRFDRGDAGVGDGRRHRPNRRTRDRGRGCGRAHELITPGLSVRPKWTGAPAHSAGRDAEMPPIVYRAGSGSGPSGRADEPVTAGVSQPRSAWFTMPWSPRWALPVARRGLPVSHRLQADVDFSHPLTVTPPLTRQRRHRRKETGITPHSSDFLHSPGKALIFARRFTGNPPAPGGMVSATGTVHGLRSRPPIDPHRRRASNIRIGVGTGRACHDGSHPKSSPANRPEPGHLSAACPLMPMRLSAGTRQGKR